MSANISTKEITNFTAHFFGCAVIFFFLHGKWSRGHILTRECPRVPSGTPERVAHERVGESPRREKNFGTSGSKIRRFVSEIWPFEVGIGVTAHFTM